MNPTPIALKPELEKLVREKVRAGLFRSAEELVNAAVEQVVAEDDFASGELESMLAVGEQQARQGHFVDGDEVFQRIRTRSATRRKGA